MIESIKKKLWDLLKEKDVSLAMLYNRKGEILWHKGREIDGKTIDEGKGFSRSYLKKVFDSHDTVEGENIVIASIAGDLPESARILKVKSFIIQPIGDYFYLYMDSGIKKAFTGADRQAFTVLGEFLEIVIEDIIRQSEFDKEGVTGSSREIKRIREQVLKYSLEEEPVLLLGETGVGK
ncbi:MAG: hypothetical protein GY950_06155, partial [bacterium]|nr:hypothetical protein [bacterium]